MINLRISELQSKDIVNTKDGKKIGRISDLVINNDGEIDYLIVEPSKILKRYTSWNNETRIKFSQITKFGSDVILVDLINK